MDALLLMLVCGVGYLIAYHTYGRFLAKKIFKLDKNASVPSVELADGIDYVPTRKGIIFGHHYASIAGTGPIVGPAIGIIWGWLPAIIWVLLGSIFMGAVHDFGTLVVSMRNQGKSISEIAAKYINIRVRFIFFAIVFLSLLIVIAIFGVVIALVFKIYPESVLPVWLEIPIAIGLGWLVYKKSANVTLATFAAVTIMYLTVALGAYLESVKPGLFTFSESAWLPATGMWTIILLTYAWIASPEAGAPAPLEPAPLSPWGQSAGVSSRPDFLHFYRQPVHLRHHGIGPGDPFPLGISPHQQPPHQDPRGVLAKGAPLRGRGMPRSLSAG